MACHEFHDKEWLDPRDCFSGLDRGPHKQKWPKFIKEKIYSELLMPALIQFKLLPCHQKMKCLHKNGNSYFFSTCSWNCSQVTATEREMPRLTTLFYFLSWALRMSMECICTNSILSHSGNDISEQAFVKEYSIFYGLG